MYDETTCASCGEPIYSGDTRFVAVDINDSSQWHEDCADWKLVEDDKIYREEA